MTDQISRRDWEHLSAYLDGQLAEKERALLAARLKQNPALQSALDDLAALRGALHSLPQMRAPRNFTLTPQMVALRPTRAARLYPTFRLASVLSSLLFVIVLLGNFFAPNRMAMAPAQELAAPAAQKIAEEEVEMIAEAPAAPAEEAAADMAVAENAGEALPEPVEAESAAEAEPALLATITPVGVTAEEESAPMMTAIPTATPAPTYAILDSLAADSEIPRTVATPLSGFALLEIILASLALTTGAVALYLRWRSRR
ncbi:MAG: hypothetical protein ISR60_08200 [Anaerolineales bacterium]|nr:hypothetical protein [Anaerolineales bacterium]